MRGLLTALLLPPLGLVLGIVALGVLAARGSRAAGALAALAALALLALATPFAAGTLRAGLEAALAAPAGAPPPGAIVILGGDSRAARGGAEPGPLTLERLRAGAALHRATGLPILVTGGPVGAGEAPIGEIMALSLAADFGVRARWVEPRAADTRGNARLSAALLREAGIGSAYLVTHGWHLPRSLDAFARAGLAAHPAPVAAQAPPTGAWADFAPRPDFLAQSWYMLREWAGRLVYAWRDG